MQLRVSRATIGQTVDADRTNTTMTFDLETMGFERITLSTGEMFGSCAKPEEAITAAMQVYRASNGKAPLDADDPERIGRMSYLKGSGTYDHHLPPSIWIVLYLADKEFDQLLESLLKGMTPRTFHFEIDGLDSVSLDGSSMKWDNKEKPHILIETVSWDIHALDPSPDEEPQESKVEAGIKALVASHRTVVNQLFAIIAILVGLGLWLRR